MHDALARLMDGKRLARRQLDAAHLRKLDEQVAEYARSYPPDWSVQDWERWILDRLKVHGRFLPVRPFAPLAVYRRPDNRMYMVTSPDAASLITISPSRALAVLRFLREHSGCYATWRAARRDGWRVVRVRLTLDTIARGRAG